MDRQRNQSRDMQWRQQSEEMTRQYEKWNADKLGEVSKCWGPEYMVLMARAAAMALKALAEAAAREAASRAAALELYRKMMEQQLGKAA